MANNIFELLFFMLLLIFGYAKWVLFRFERIQSLHLILTLNYPLHYLFRVSRDFSCQLPAAVFTPRILLKKLFDFLFENK